MLLKRYGVPVELSSPAEAEVVTAGSILEHLPPSWAGTVIGTGRLFPAPVRLPRARVLAARGALTAHGLGATVPLGDPGLLARQLVPRQRPDINVGIVPHWSDTELAEQHDGVLIDPRGDPLGVLTAIASCERVITSSLHGLIVADAYGIPVEPHLPASAAREGCGFKFQDHASALGAEMRFGQVWHPPVRRVRKLREVLGEVFEGYAASVTDHPVQGG